MLELCEHACNEWTQAIIDRQPLPIRIKTHWLVISNWTRSSRYEEIHSVGCDLQSGMDLPDRGSVSPSLLHREGHRVQRVLSRAGTGSGEHLRDSVRTGELQRRPRGLQTLGRTVQVQKRGRPGEMADQVFQSDLSMLWYAEILLFWLMNCRNYDLTG